MDSTFCVFLGVPMTRSTCICKEAGGGGGWKCIYIYFNVSVFIQKVLLRCRYVVSVHVCMCVRVCVYT